MKKSVIVIAVLFIFSIPAYAQMGMMGDRSGNDDEGYDADDDVHDEDAKEDDERNEPGREKRDDDGYGQDDGQDGKNDVRYEGYDDEGHDESRPC